MDTQRVTDAISALEPTPGDYHPCGIEDVDKTYQLIMNDRPRERPSACPLRRKLVGEYIDEIERNLSTQE